MGNDNSIPIKYNVKKITPMEINKISVNSSGSSYFSQDSPTINNDYKIEDIEEKDVLNDMSKHGFHRIS